MDGHARGSGERGLSPGLSRGRIRIILLLRTYQDPVVQSSVFSTVCTRSTPSSQLFAPSRLSGSYVFTAIPFWAVSVLFLLYLHLFFFFFTTSTKYLPQCTESGFFFSPCILHLHLGLLPALYHWCICHKPSISASPVSMPYQYYILCPEFTANTAEGRSGFMLAMANPFWLLHQTQLLLGPFMHLASPPEV